MKIYDHRKFAKISLEEGDQIAYSCLSKFTSESYFIPACLEIYVHIEGIIYNARFHGYDEDLIKINLKNRKFKVYEVFESHNLDDLIWETYHP
ncbi:hypothetical protein COV12_03250 [Candidatus Woesearchaeota archaeon CG10_big_fil_rev_8_21_14_0_10_32_24]|nr:MAG: hypothetical protein COV12_03250 [Candidatus Woesearchaeota archaeon CG10_big_fil_rev_8_21_14_0_10_32_24]